MISLLIKKGFLDGMQRYFRQVRGDTFIHFDQETDTSYIYTDYDIIKRFEIGSIIKIGCQGIMLERLVVDLFVGLGVKYYHAQYEYEVPDFSLNLNQCF
ncbi:MAG: hypothetical protein U9N86_16110 [Bacteroidota bacterium]|nr:hypothetical protein [Bacteroidota bacterium]